MENRLFTISMEYMKKLLKVGIQEMQHKHT